MPARPEDSRPVTVPVTEEHLEIDRRVTDSGRPLRLRKQVREEPVEIDLDTVSDRIRVERVPIGRVVIEQPAVRQEGDVTIVPVVEERVVLTRELVLVEELRLVRERERSTETSEVTLRRETVAVERFDPATQRWNAEDVDPS